MPYWVLGWLQNGGGLSRAFTVVHDYVCSFIPKHLIVLKLTSTYKLPIFWFVLGFGGSFPRRTVMAADDLSVLWPRCIYVLAAHLAVLEQPQIQHHQIRAFRVKQHQTQLALNVKL